MEKQIKEIQEKFKELIINGNYSITDISDATIKIRINNLYNFEIWIYEKSFQIFHNGSNFIKLPQLSIEERNIGFKNLQSFKELLNKKEIEINEKKIEEINERIQELKKE